jgi:hypothetical protein
MRGFLGDLDIPTLLMATSSQIADLATRSVSTQVAHIRQYGRHMPSAGSAYVPIWAVSLEVSLLCPELVGGVIV